MKIVGLNRKVLDRHGAKSKPIWLTELTWSSAKGKKKKLTQNWETTEAGQALRLRQAYRLFEMEGELTKKQLITIEAEDIYSSSVFD